MPGDETVAITCAPPRRAICTAYRPTAPAPPVTSTVCPVTGPSPITAYHAVIAGIPKQAPSAKLVPSGSRTACSAGSATWSAAVPKARCQPAFQTQTRSPTRAASTPAPTASITPAPSEWGITRG